MRVAIKRLDPRATVPQYHSPGAAAFDLHACLPEGASLLIPAGSTVAVPTKLAAWVRDPGFCLEIWERSGLGKKGVQRRGGLVDSDYQGELLVMLTNGTDSDFRVDHGDRIAQAKITPVIRAEFEEVEDFGVNTVRGAAGFGSTGKGL
jgi:dUTP pyrophosphatase